MWKFIVIFILAFLSLLISQNEAYAQPTTVCDTVPSLEEKVAQQLRNVSQDIVIECLTDKIAVFAFEEIKSMFGWTAVDAFTKSNYTVKDVVSSGMGTEANPTRFFVVMTRD